MDEPVTFRAMSDGYTASMQEFLNRQRHCLNCGTEMLVVGKQYYRGYCCYECFMRRTPITAYLEDTFKADARTVVLTALSVAPTVTRAAKALGIQRETLMYLIKRFNIKKVVKWK